MKKIAVLGAGGTGHAIAADLTLAGFELRLYEEPKYRERLNYVLARQGIGISGGVRQGFATLSCITTEIEEALQDAQVIFVSVVASRHQTIAQLCAPYLKNGQTIVIGPDNGGSLVFADVLQTNREASEIKIAGIAGNFYPCRLIGPAEVIVGLPRSPKRIAAFPGRDTNEIIKSLSEVYDFVAGTNVLEIALSSPNVVIHLAGSILNTGAIENSGGAYYLYHQGITPSVLKCIDAIKTERSELFRVLGYSVKASNLLEKVSKRGQYPELNMFRGLIGPTSMQHRYITEDASTGMALMVSLAQMVNVPVPVSHALITLASAINQTDYLKEGRTIDKLGLSGLSVEKLNQYLAEGEL
jgi:opine dehydrogenase